MSRFIPERTKNAKSGQCKKPARPAMTVLSAVIILIHVLGCSALYQNYIDQTVDPPAEVEKALATRGELNVILLPGCATEPGRPDTLFSCLKLSRDVNPESVKLPPGEKLYLGHVSEFIVNALKYYQIRESFKDFYGYRVILKFRKLTPQELRSKQFADYSGFFLGSASTVAGAVTMMPLGAVIFLADGIKTEIDRQNFEERAEKMELPEPKKNTVIVKLESAGRYLLHIKDKIVQGLTGNKSERVQFDDKITGYVVEECLLEKVAPEEMDRYRGQINVFRNSAGSPPTALPENVNADALP